MINVPIVYESMKLVFVMVISFRTMTLFFVLFFLH